MPVTARKGRSVPIRRATIGLRPKVVELQLDLTPYTEVTYQKQRNRNHGHQREWRHVTISFWMVAAIAKFLTTANRRDRANG